MLTKPPLFFAFFLLLAGAACSTQSAAPTPSLPNARVSGHRPLSQYISHVVVIIQENRTFENFFAGYPGANAPMFGYGKSGGKRVKIALHQTTFEGPSNITHLWPAAIAEWDNGNMDGFNQFGVHGRQAAYAYVERSQLTPYYKMAQQYVLADAMFPTEFGPSFTGHLTLVAGTDNVNATDAEADFPDHTPNDCDSPPGTKSTIVDSQRIEHKNGGPFPCFNQWNTMAEDLDNAGVSWKYYVTRLHNAGIWSAYEAIKYVRRGPDWKKDIIAPQTKILTDPGQNALASVSWVTPSKEDSDHPGAHSDQGPSWVASIVNAIGESPYWNSSAIVVVWDDWGGWYDNAVPPQLDFRGLGIRVPCLIISPYAKANHVSHTVYEFGSVLKFIEQVYDLPPLGPASEGYSDARSNSIIDSFDFTQKARKFVPISSKYPMSHFIHEPPSDEAVDDE